MHTISYTCDDASHPVFPGQPRSLPFSQFCPGVSAEYSILDRGSDTTFRVWEGGLTIYLGGGGG